MHEIVTRVDRPNRSCECNSHNRHNFKRFSSPFYRALLISVCLVISQDQTVTILTAQASTTTTPGTLTLSSTFEAISVRAKYSGDTNANNSAITQYRKSGDATWHDAYPPVVDRRTSINGTDNTAFAFEARGSIVGLTPNTLYEVRLTWTDPNGITSSSSISDTISTLSYNPPASPIIRWVNASVVSEGLGTLTDPFKTISNAIAQANAGDTIMVKAGSYAPFTITKSGTPSAYFVLKASPGETVNILGTPASCITINANYWRLIGLRFTQIVESSIVVAANRHHIYIEDTISADVGTGNVWGSGGVSLRQNTNNIYILRNSFTRSTPGIDNVAGVFLQGIGTHTIVIADNTISGTFWDGIGNGVNSYTDTMQNSDFARNTFTNWLDDSIEMDGGSANLRVWGNTARSNRAFSLLSEAGTIVGPSYVFRNTFVGTSPHGTGLKQGHNGVGSCFLFHNVIETVGSGANEAVGQAGGAPYSENHVYRNNIIKATGNVYYREGRSNSYDYNLLYAPEYTLVSAWNGSGTYSTLASFRSTGQELNGVSGDPKFLSGNKDILSTSPAHDAGVVLANFNTVDSAWPFSGSAPDIGAFEFQSGGPAPPSPPTNLRIIP